MNIPDFTTTLLPSMFEDAYRQYLRGMRAVAEYPNVSVGVTPKDQIWQLNKARLYRYQPTRPPEERYPVPLLLVYALINKPYIFDLRPGQSFVEFLLDRGFDVYLLDWGTPGPEDRHIRFDDYATQYIPRAARKMLRVSGAKEFSILGYCIGGTLTMLYAALHPEAPIRNIVLLTAPIDFGKRDSIFAPWFDERHFDVDRFVDSLGNIPVELVEVGSKMMKPVENYIGTYSNLWDRLDDEGAVESWQAINKWVNDGIPFTGEAFRQWVKEYIRGNKLVSGESQVQGQRINLANIRAPLLSVIAEHDHIVPKSHSTTVLDLVSSQDKHLEVIPAGHVGIMSGRGARNKLWPKIAAWLGERSQGDKVTR